MPSLITHYITCSSINEGKYLAWAGREIWMTRNNSLYEILHEVCYKVMHELYWWNCLHFLHQIIAKHSFTQYYFFAGTLIILYTTSADIFMPQGRHPNMTNTSYFLLLYFSNLLFRVDDISIIWSQLTFTSTVRIYWSLPCHSHKKVCLSEDLVMIRLLSLWSEPPLPTQSTAHCYLTEASLYPPLRIRGLCDIFSASGRARLPGLLIG